MQVLATCSGCGLCLPYCPQGALSLVDGRAVVDPDACVECLICVDIGLCPRQALEPGGDENAALKQRYGQMVDSVRGGTKKRTVDICDVKKCDVSPFAFPPASVMLEIEAGRPLGGVTLGKLNALRRLLRERGLEPTMRGRHAAYLDPATGLFPEDKAHIRILYLAQQTAVGLADLPSVLDDLEDWARRNQVCLTLNATLPPSLEEETRAVLTRANRPAADRMKANLGLGRARSAPPRSEDKGAAS